MEDVVPIAEGRGTAMRSVTTALQVLEAVAVNQPVGLSALTRILGMPKSTVQRNLATLAEAGWIEPYEGSGRWQVAVRAFVVGSVVGSRGGLRSAALPVMKSLSGEVGETVHLMVPSGRDVVLVERIDSPRPVRAVAPLGARGPLHATSNGKAILASVPPAEAEAYLVEGLSAVTERTIVEPAMLRAELEAITELGYATCHEEFEEGVVSVGAAVRRGGRPVASLSISGPASRMLDDLLNDYGKKVHWAAESIAAALPA
jgi:IclR family acetate operon transcriptional repressor